MDKKGKSKTGTEITGQTSKERPCEEEKTHKREIVEYGIVTVLTVLMFLLVMGALTGKGLTDRNPYNTYALQAEAWRNGHLDLGQDYPWLELAIYEGKYYVSFPPFPSYLLFPFTFFFGNNTPDFLILLAVNLITALFLYKTAVKMELESAGAVIGTLFVLLGSNMVFLLIDPSVWFFAQTLSFSTAVLALYFAVSRKGAASLFFWACSVGCRPMQAVFLPVLLYVLYHREKEQFPDETLWALLKRRWRWAVPVSAVAVSYMILNYMRFGSITEFGHNYLPEFVRAEHGQFHISYMKANIQTLFRMPSFTEDGRMTISTMGGLSMLIINPIVVIFLLEILYAVIVREKRLALELSGIFVLSFVYMLIVVMHRTMGAWHFGNRYSNDILPWIYFGTVMVHAKHPKLIKYQIPFAVAASALNLVGSVAVYNGWV